MGWLDKLLGRDKEDASEPAGTSTSVESDMDAAGAPDDLDPHAGHDHPDPPRSVHSAFVRPCVAHDFHSPPMPIV